MNVPANTGIQLPAYLQNLWQQEQGNNDLSSGVNGGFPVISIKGKVFRIKAKGTDTPITDPATGAAMPFLDVVIVRASSAISKIFYASGFAEGSNNPPDCWSQDGKVPDPEAGNKQAQACAACPHHVWGSKITPEGKKTRACADVRRLALIAPSDLGCQQHGAPYLMRVPGGSLANLAEYGDVLSKVRLVYPAMITRVGFDINKAYPQLTFTPVRPLTEAELAQVMQWRNSPEVERILATSIQSDSDVGAEVATPVATAQMAQAVHHPAPQPVAMAVAPQPAPTPVQPAPVMQVFTQPAPQPAPAPAQQPAAGFGFGFAPQAPAPQQAAPQPAPQPASQPEPAKRGRKNGNGAPAAEAAPLTQVPDELGGLVASILNQN